jgi:hypothetical protein
MCSGRDYSVAIFVIFNFVLFLFIAAGQGFIYWSVQKASLHPVDTTRKAKKDTTIARRLITVAMSDFLCWFPKGRL